MGLSHSVYDHSLFIYHHGNNIAYILLYVDDIILVAWSNTFREPFIAQLSSEFAMKYLRPLGYFLGISITRHSKGFFFLKRNKHKKL